MAAGAEAIMNEDYIDGVYVAYLSNTRGEQIFANPGQLTQALNNRPNLGGGFEHDSVDDETHYWTKPNNLRIFLKFLPHASPTHMYGITIVPYNATQFETKVETIKSVLSGEAAAPAGSGRRRKNRKTKKASRRRRITRRSYL